MENCEHCGDCCAAELDELYNVYIDEMALVQDAKEIISVAIHATEDHVVKDRCREWLAKAQKPPIARPDCQRIVLREAADALQQRERWEKCGEQLHYGGQPKRLVDIAALLNAHGITPASLPIDKERGRELVRGCDNVGSNFKQMRDWIASVCGKDG